MASVEKMAAPSVVDGIVRAISDDIINGLYRPGERLVEAELARRYSGGRNSIREAMQRLRDAHFIYLEANRGATVSDPDAAEILSVFDVRETLLGLGARLAAQRVGMGEGMDVALALEDEVRAQIAAPNRTTYGSDNLRFHRTVNSLSGNDHIAELMLRYRLPILDSIYWRDISEEGMLEDLREHADIIRAVVRGDAVAAEHFARLHEQKKRTVAIEIAVSIKQGRMDYRLSA